MLVGRTIYKNENVFVFVITIHTTFRYIFLYRNENHFRCPSAHNHMFNESVAQFRSSKPNYKNETEFQIPYKADAFRKQNVPWNRIHDYFCRKIVLADYKTLYDNGDQFGGSWCF